MISARLKNNKKETVIHSVRRSVDILGGSLDSHGVAKSVDHNNQPMYRLVKVTHVCP
jgi:hypothetical protein